MRERISTDLRERIRPLVIGLSVSTRYSSAGTLGYFVKVGQGHGFLSSSNSLAADKSAKKGESVYQPGTLDANTLLSSDDIGQLHSFLVPSTDKDNMIDASLVILREDVDFISNIIPKFLACQYAGESLSTPKSATKLSAGTSLAKVGRTTGFTIGSFTSIMDELVVNYPSKGEVSFSGMIEITGHDFSKPGDSGSLVFTLPDLHPVGILVAVNNRSKTYACQLEEVLSILEVEPL